MKKIALTLLFLFCTPMLLYPNDLEKPKSPITYDQTLYNALLDDELILNFVSHPKVINYAVSSVEKGKELYQTAMSKLIPFAASLSDFPEFQENLNLALEETEIFTSVLQHEGPMAAFLIFGIADTTAITDPIILQEVQQLQVKLFRNWLSIYKIGSNDYRLLPEELKYCNNSNLDFFSAIISPFLFKLEKLDYDLGDVMDFYIGYDFSYNAADEKNDDTDFSDDDEELITNENSIEYERLAAFEKALSDFMEEEKELVDAEKEFSKSVSVDALVRLFLEINS